MRKLIVGLITGMLLMIGSPAQAADPYFTTYPTVKWPIARKALDKGTDLDVVLVGRRRLFGMRNAAQFIDDRVSGLRIHKRRGIRCSDVPSASLCVRVRVANFGRTGWVGLTNIEFATGTRDIYLNTYYVMTRRTAAHEFVHVLGMAHHAYYGIVGKGSSRYPSARELTVLNTAY